MKSVVKGIIIAALLACVAGCGPSKDEWEAKIKEVDDLKAQLADLKAQYDAAVGKLTEENKGMLEQLNDLTKAKMSLEDLVNQLKKKQEQAKERLNMIKNMLSKFKALIEAGKLKVEIRDGKMVLVLPSAVLFESGKADLKEDGEMTLSEVAPVLASITGREYQVAGHTDDVPIKKKMFPSNWELSTARAVAVVKYLQEQGVPATSLSAAGYSEFAPVAANDSEGGKASNRRIEIILMPNLEELPDLGDIEEMLK
ncbi:MAG: OmpA family protein [Pseudomonadota bacterium]